MTRTPPGGRAEQDDEWDDDGRRWRRSPSEEWRAVGDGEWLDPSGRRWRKTLPEEWRPARAAYVDSPLPTAEDELREKARRKHARRLERLERKRE
jgi:hypothetical protein